MAYNFRENNFAVAQFQEIDGWQVAEMTGIQEGIGGEGVVTSFTVLKLKSLIPKSKKCHWDKCKMKYLTSPNMTISFY